MTLTAVMKGRQRTQTSREVVRPGNAVIAGKSYAAAVDIQAAKPEQRSDGEGTIIVQRAVVRIRKTLLAAAPARGTVVGLGDLDFNIDDTGGQNVGDVAWVLHLTRLP